MFKTDGTVIAIPPGAYIEEVLEEYNVPLKALAGALSMSMEEAQALISGDIPLTEALAADIADILHIPCRFLLNLEHIYRKKLSIINAQDS